MKEDLELRTNEAWDEALKSWNHPSIPRAIAVKSKEEAERLGDRGKALEKELAFMAYPEFQTYLNLENIEEKFPEDPQRGVNAVSKHEAGHRFCPYDTITSIILRHAAEKQLEKSKIPYSTDAASNLVLNLFSDMCINTNLTRKGDEDIPWAYKEISKKNKTDLWKVYAKSMGLAWNQEVLPQDAELTEPQLKAAEELAGLFQKDFFLKEGWKNNIITYARTISPFLKDENKDKEGMPDCTSDNIPQTLDEKTKEELAKRLSEIGSNGLPTNPSGLKEFKEIIAGFGEGNPTKASIAFYDKLSDAYNVTFATKPFGRPRTSPFQPIKWSPSMGVEALDIDYSVQVGGRIIPGVNAYSWKNRKREIYGGLEEVVPNLDLYLDSSGSMPNPLEQISLPVLAGFVVAKKAHRKGAKIRSTVFSARNQSKTQEFTSDLSKIFENLVIYYNGGTDFPTASLLEQGDPKQVLVITDTFLGNEIETAEAAKELIRRNKGNKVTIYAIHPSADAEYLKNAGAEVINGTTTDIFKRVIGKGDEVYSR